MSEENNKNENKELILFKIKDILCGISNTHVQGINKQLKIYGRFPYPV